MQRYEKYQTSSRFLRLFNLCAFFKLHSAYKSMPFIAKPPINDMDSENK